ncbi:MAG: YraN family protein [Bacteroidota bacterium]
MKDNKTIGDRGEELAANYLKDKGYEILVRNYRYKRSEIDIICKHNSLLVFIEVKTRKNNTYGEPEASVDQKKAAKVIEGAEQYIEEIDWHGDIRFDIISILLKKPPEIEHFEDAFY